MTPDALPLRVLAAQADRHQTHDRVAFARAARAGLERPEPGTAATDAAGAAALLVTCHRVEVVAAGGTSRGRVDAAAGAAGAAGVGGLRSYEGRQAAEHLFRLAAGLESAVTGEDEILHQVRELLDTVRASGGPDPLLVRALELAIGVGRRARAERARPQERSLADRSLDWLASQGIDLSRSRVLVVGSGAMGRALAVGASRRGASVGVASRDPERARRVGRLVDGEAWTLDEAAAAFGSADGVLIALAGPWGAVDPVVRAPLAALPPLVVDLSSPPALSAAARARLDGRHIGIDRLFGARPAMGEDAERARREYVAHAEALVADAAERLERWAEARPSVETLRALRRVAELRRARDLERLLRRLPDLGPRERALVTEFSEQLVAGILHRPSARLHDDADGRAAAAARLLFDL